MSDSRKLIFNRNLVNSHSFLYRYFFAKIIFYNEEIKRSFSNTHYQQQKNNYYFSAIILK